MEVSAAGGAWSTALQGVAPPVVTVGNLEDAASYHLRLVVSNAHGQSAPSEPSDALLTDGSHVQLLEPPDVSAISSSSYAVSWVDRVSQCRKELTYSVQMRRQDASGADEAGWTTVRSAVARPTVEVTDTACPQGCAFRYRAEGIRGWSSFSHASQYLPTHSLAAIPVGGERLQCRIRADIYPAADVQATAELYVSELAAALDLPSAQISVREAREGGVVVLDLAPGTGDLAALAPSAQLARLRDLVLHASRGSSRSLQATIELQRMRPPSGSPEMMLSEAEVTAARGAQGLLASPVLLVAGAIGGALVLGLLLLRREYSGFGKVSGDDYVHPGSSFGASAHAQAVVVELPVRFTLSPQDAAVVGTGETEYESKLQMAGITSMLKLRRELREACALVTGLSVVEIAELAYVDEHDDEVTVGPRTLLMDVKAEAQLLKATPLIRR